MNRNECKVWMNYHFSLFPEFRTWWQAETKESRAVAWEGYVKGLRSIDLTDATEASNAILAGHAKKPWEHQETLAAVVKASYGIKRDRNPTPKPVDGQATFNCPDCLDTGWIDHVYNGTEKAADGSALPKYFADGNHCYVTTCHCSHGDKHRGRPWGSGKASRIGT